MGTGTGKITMEAIDLITPTGIGQLGLIVAPKVM
jgi:transcription termination factor Rho